MAAITLPYFSSSNLTALFPRSVNVIWLFLHLAMLCGFALTTMAILSLALLGAANPTLPRTILSPASRIPLISVAFAIGLVATLVLLTCIFDTGDPRQRSSADIAAWFVAFYGIRVWQKLHKRALSAHG